MVKKGKIAKQAIEDKLEKKKKQRFEGESTPGGHAQGLETDDNVRDQAEDLGLRAEEEVEKKKETWKGLSPFQAFLKKLGIKRK
jgi:hypothetical protein